jgi:hypothetical protein
MYLQKGALYPRKLDQVVKGCKSPVISSRYVSGGLLRVSAEDAENRCWLLEKVAQIEDLPLLLNQMLTGVPSEKK